MQPHVFAKDRPAANLASRLKVVHALHYNMLLAAASYDFGMNDLTDFPIVQLSSDLT
jgi:hypothetical protein